VALRDGAERQLTFGEESYVQPDIGAAGQIVAARIRSQSDIWKFPVNASPTENVRNGVRITHQTGLAQTPSLSPDGKELVYLSDSGGHGNLWITKTDGSAVRQITFERRAEVSVGVPVWSPASDQIVFIISRAGKTGEWLVNADGSNLREFIPEGSSAFWSPDGRWLYHEADRGKDFCIKKAPLAGGPSVEVRCENAAITLGIGRDSTFYFASQKRGVNGGWDYNILRANPENGLAKKLGDISGVRSPVDPSLLQLLLSPDEKQLAGPLLDGGTSNFWTMPSSGGPMRRLTDFGARSVVIARRFAWSHDSKSIYAAVAETDADIVQVIGLLY
jgi:Tol biopolymer transport system component